MSTMSCRAAAPLQFLHLVGREDWSSEWARQCQMNTLLRMSPAQRLRFLKGSAMRRMGATAGRSPRFHGQAGAHSLKADLERMEEIVRVRPNCL